jgi:hypothetical protein
VDFGYGAALTITTISPIRSGLASCPKSSARLARILHGIHYLRLYDAAWGDLGLAAKRIFSDRRHPLGMMRFNNSLGKKINIKVRGLINYNYVY